MSSRYIERWVLSLPTRANGQAKVLDYCADVILSRTLQSTPVVVLSRCAFDNDEIGLRAAQADPDVLVIPAKTVKASRAPQRVKNWLAANGIILDPDDTGTNVVRKIRDQLIKKTRGREIEFVISD